MNKTFNLLFYLKKAKINSQGEVPIYMRITIDGKVSEISTKRIILPLKWNTILTHILNARLIAISPYLSVYYEGKEPSIKEFIIIHFITNYGYT